MADTKPGKVIRLNPKLLNTLSKYRSAKESWSDIILRLVGNTDVTMWTLPSKLYSSKSEARGIAVQEAALDGRTLDNVEQPIKVTERY